MSSTYSLYRVHPTDESEEYVASYPTYVAGLQAGEDAADEHEDDTFVLRSDFDDTRMGRFGWGRLGYWQWAHRRGYIHSLDDRYDHDVDLRRMILNRVAYDAVFGYECLDLL